MEFSKVAKVGDVIKAMDFEPIPGVGESFVIGTVLEKTHFNGYQCYKIITEQSQFGGRPDDSRIGLITYVPFNGVFDFDNRVTKVEMAIA